MNSVWLSKPYLAFYSVAVSTISLYAYDRYKLKELMKPFQTECTQLGCQPLSASALPRTITFILSAANRYELDSKKDLFIRYALPLFNSAGIEHQWLEWSTQYNINEYERQNETEKDKGLDEDTIKKVGEYFKKIQWPKLLAASWSNGKLEIDPQPELPLVIEKIAPVIMKSYKPLTDTMKIDGLILLDPNDEIEFKKTGINVRLIECLPLKPWYIRFINFFNQRNVALNIARQAMEVIRE